MHKDLTEMNNSIITGLTVTLYELKKKRKKVLDVEIQN